MSLPAIDPRAAAVLDAWFGPDFATLPASQVAAQRYPFWFGKHDEVDADLRARFASLLNDAAANRLGDWADAPLSLLALAILFDQLPRNIHRDTPQAFAFDPLARQCTGLMLATGFDRQLPALARVFAYLPLEHAEDPDDQEQSVALFNALAREQQADEAARKTFSDFADYARRHRDIIARFGRFPHRNAILGRTSTPEETDFLRQPGSSF